MLKYVLQSLLYLTKTYFICILYILYELPLQQKTCVCSCLHGHSPHDIYLCLLLFLFSDDEEMWSLSFYTGVGTRYQFFILCMLLSFLTLIFFSFIMLAREIELYVITFEKKAKSYFNWACLFDKVGDIFGFACWFVCLFLFFLSAEWNRVGFSCGRGNFFHSG